MTKRKTIAAPEPPSFFKSIDMPVSYGFRAITILVIGLLTYFAKGIYEDTQQMGKLVPVLTQQVTDLGDKVKDVQGEVKAVWTRIGSQRK